MRYRACWMKGPSGALQRAAGLFILSIAHDISATVSLTGPFFFLAEPPSFLQGGSQQIFNLTVQAAQFIVGHPAQIVEDFLVDAQEERFACHYRKLPQA